MSTPPVPEVPPMPWGAICDAIILGLLVNTPPNNRPAEAAALTARSIDGWHAGTNPTPQTDDGFHEGFIRNTTDRRATRERLIRMIRDAIAALDRTCGVGTFVVHIVGELPPSTGQQRMTPALMQSNARLTFSDTLRFNQAFASAREHVTNVVRTQFAPTFGRDWRHHAVNSNFLRESAVLLEDVQAAPAPPLTPHTPAPHQSTPSSQFSPYSQSVFSTPQPSPSRSRARTAPTSPASPSPMSSIESSLARLSVQRPGPSEAGPSRIHMSTVEDTRSLPSSVLDLLEALGYDEDSEMVQVVEVIYNDYGHSRWEAELITLPFNSGTCCLDRAELIPPPLKYICRSSTSGRVPLVAVAVAVAVASFVTLNDEAPRKRAKTAPKSDEQRAADKAHRLDVDQKLNLALEKAAADIDEIIDGVADTFSKSFEEVSRLLQLAFYVAKKRRSPNSYNAYIFCAARIKDGRWDPAKDPSKKEVAEIIALVDTLPNGRNDLTEDQHNVLVACLQSDRDERETGVLMACHQRSGLEYLVLASSSQVNGLKAPTILMTKAAGDFITQVLHVAPVEAIKRFAAYVLNHSGITGVIEILRGAKKSLKAHMRNMITEIFHQQLAVLLGFKLRMEYEMFESRIREKHKLVVEGWPDGIKFVKPSSLTAIGDIKKVFEALNDGTCFIRHADQPAGVGPTTTSCNGTDSDNEFDIRISPSSPPSASSEATTAAVAASAAPAPSTVAAPGAVAAPPAVPTPVTATVVPAADASIPATTTVVTAADASIPATTTVVTADASIPATTTVVTAADANIPMTAANSAATVPAVLAPTTAAIVPATAAHVPASDAFDASADAVTHGPTPLSVIPIPQAASDTPTPSNLTMSAGLYVPPAMEFVGPGGVPLTGPGPEATVPQKRGYDFGFGAFDDGVVYKTPRLTESQWSSGSSPPYDIEAHALGLPEGFVTAPAEVGTWGGSFTDLLMDGLGDMNNL
ncbi:hypothetical protein FA95DRAFT_1578329 [Auriscalpium vulgare]|uniref:Uncharacterized protein n=1 Tax=Auriscalpium vulgare TaxID=40419 RepID=A0ACB8R3W3_9AGAM|nr:hypothetical protein FA95DRAFT_1578329 [Auriscalpium vulgare]